MGISVTMIKDSLSVYKGSDKQMYPGIRITTMLLRYPRFVHAELMTHRVFSRNASSSRAIPVMTMLKQIIFDPAMPEYWGANEKGMQAKRELTGWRLRAAKTLWRLARYPAVAAAFIAYKIGLHKQIANRICEPWAHITVLVTSTEYRNFFNLRLHKDAQPEIRILAEKMADKMAKSDPTWLMPGEWHLPFVTHGDVNNPTLTPSNLIALSVARCARTSYLTHDKQSPSREQDLALYDRLVGSTPLHASPAEHQASPDNLLIDVASTHDWRYNQACWAATHLHGNFNGWIQFRKTLPDENTRG